MVAGLLGGAVRAPKALVKGEKGVTNRSARQRWILDIKVGGSAMFDQLTNVPDWLGAGVVAAITAALGYVLKGFIEGRKEKGALRESERKEERARQESELAHLKHLASLLSLSDQIFGEQLDKAQRLENTLYENHPKEMNDLPDKYGYAQVFYDMFPHYTPEEAKLHAVIRATTESSLRSVNQDVGTWLKEDRVFKDISAPEGKRSQLAKMLRQLELHLSTWHATYEATIPKDEKWALVYVADEQQLGVGFPRPESPEEQKIEELVADVISDYEELLRSSADK